MYVTTLATSQGLLRIDLLTRTTLLGLITLVHYTTTDNDGLQWDSQSTLGPDIDGVGLPSVAVREVLLDLNFAGLGGEVRLVHESSCFNFEDFNAVLDGLIACLKVQHGATSCSIQ